VTSVVCVIRGIQSVQRTHATRGVAQWKRPRRGGARASGTVDADESSLAPGTAREQQLDWP
jgi:hypothetical protein